MENDINVAENLCLLPQKIMIFEPTWEEFKDFGKYIKFMEDQGAHHAGIAKIKPPPEYQPTDTTKLQGFCIYGDIIHQKLKGNNGVFKYEMETPSQIGRGGRKARVPQTSLAKFEKDANNNPAPDLPEQYLEQSFWREVFYQPLPVYAYDRLGSLMREDLEDWNLNKLGTILDLVKENQDDYEEFVSSYLHFGTWRSFFVWHTEDYELYSVTYLHKGFPKWWYAIPPTHARKFEALANKLIGNKKKCPNILRHRDCFITPDLLDKHKIPYEKVVQNEGELIITFPYCYHSNFNAGFNIAESATFATTRWIEYGKWAKLCTCAGRNQCRIYLGPFVKKHQPKNYQDWKNGKDLGSHPQFPNETGYAPPPPDHEKDVWTSDESSDIELSDEDLCDEQSCDKSITPPNQTLRQHHGVILLNETGYSRPPTEVFSDEDERTAEFDKISADEYSDPPLKKKKLAEITDNSIDTTPAIAQSSGAFLSVTNLNADDVLDDQCSLFEDGTKDGGISSNKALFGDEDEFEKVKEEFKLAMRKLVESDRSLRMDEERRSVLENTVAMFQREINLKDHTLRRLQNLLMLDQNVVLSYPEKNLVPEVLHTFDGINGGSDCRKSFKCELCGRRYSSKGALQFHIKTKHKFVTSVKYRTKQSIP